MVLLSIIGSTTAYAQVSNGVSSTPPVFDKCEAEQAASDMAGREMQAAYAGQGKGEDFHSQACTGGKVTWAETRITIPVPEITMKPVRWTLNVPQTRMVNREFLVPITRNQCDNVKTGQYPETRCEDTWIEAFGIKTNGPPNCTVTWHDIISTVCHPVIEQHKAVVGVPEFYTDSADIIYNVPNISMKDQTMIFGVPKFHPESGCVGADCEAKCKQDTERYAEDKKTAQNGIIAAPKKKVASATAAIFQCNIANLEKLKIWQTSRGDSQVRLTKGIQDLMLQEGMTDGAQNMNGKIEEAMHNRQDENNKIDAQLAMVREEQAKALASINSQ